jgi:hypothetical protein
MFFRPLIFTLPNGLGKMKKIWLLWLFQKNKYPKMKGQHSRILRKKALLVGKAEGIPAYRVVHRSSNGL